MHYNSWVYLFALWCVCHAVVRADIYLHNPRGSNNRLQEANNNRKNANRLFDSQNNNQGGYNVGKLYYYAGSELSIEFTAQHGTNNPNVHDEIIVQYSCAEQLPGVRDGTVVTTIPEDPFRSNAIEFGQHETYDYYRKCKLRERNRGLFTADRLNPNDHGRMRAIHTRQNPNGNRYGFECTEERDYYPYWHPSPWIDLAIMTSNTARCEYYRTTSENAVGRHECTYNSTMELTKSQMESYSRYNTEKSCVQEGGIWVQRPPHNAPLPKCIESCRGRDNHLGNVIGGYPCTINVTIPNIESKSCVLRVRYNISSSDYDGWSVSSANNTHSGASNPLVGARYPSGSQNVFVRNNPKVDIGIGVDLQMNFNTDQISRVFQDRSHVFEIRKRPSHIPADANIYNLNVRGKRGNIVQVYPGVEYDFVPNQLNVAAGDYIHFQWTGSNTNPDGNDGEGQLGTDRSNMVQIKDARMNFPMAADWNIFDDPSMVKKFALLRLPQVGGQTSTLDDVGTYFDGGVTRMNRTGRYHYMSTRNNNFSNRSQKGAITVTGTQSGSSAVSTPAVVGITAASVVGALTVGAVIAIVIAAAVTGTSVTGVISMIALKLRLKRRSQLQHLAVPLGKN